jgi:hypothetical protein
MKTAALTVSVVLLGLAMGCKPGQIKPSAATQPVRFNQTKEGLSLDLMVPQRNLVRGDKVEMTVVAKNVSDKPATVTANSGAPVFIRIYRKAGNAWEQVAQYPQTAAMVKHTWTLAPQEVRKFPMTIPVSPEWPVNEPLQITAELNGRPDLCPTGIIRVFLTRAQCNRASVY